MELHDAIRTQDNDSGSDDFVSFVGLMSNLTEITTCIMLYNTDQGWYFDRSKLKKTSPVVKIG